MRLLHSLDSLEKHPQRMLGWSNVRGILESKLILYQTSYSRGKQEKVPQGLRMTCRVVNLDSDFQKKKNIHPVIRSWVKTQLMHNGEKNIAAIHGNNSILIASIDTL